MSFLFEHMTIVGVGLLGGSLGLSCKEKGVAKKIIGYGRQIEKVREAEKQGIIDEATNDLSKAVVKADLVVLCTPVQSISSKTRELVSWLKPGAIITDVGSVKGSVIQEIETFIPHDIHYIGSHPIAGGERSGFKEARANLYQKALCILTPTEKTNKMALGQITQFWKRLGAKIVTLDPEEHDLIYGGVSHLPHVLAFALMNAIGVMKTPRHNKFFSFGGNGIFDYTRIASSDPVMWRDILLANRNFVLQHLRTFQQSLNSLVTGIEQEDGPKLLEAFISANDYREELLKNKK